MPNYSSAGTSSHDPYNGLEVENITEVLCEKRGETQAQGNSYGHAITINMFPDDVLLAIFDSCRKDRDPGWSTFTTVWGWHRLVLGLVHVCQRWRQLIFGSPRHLDLQLPCTHGIPMRKNLGCWPPFPIAIQYNRGNILTLSDEDSLFAALEHPDRVRHVDLCLLGSQIGEVVTVMQVPFPALTRLTLRWEEERPPALPSGFLGGSAPYLRYLHLEGILFPTLPTLLSSTSDLVNLSLDGIAQDAYISPEAMVACLAALPKLKFLLIGFQLATSRPDRIRPPPVTRTVVPSLISFEFHGASEYLEDLVARIDSPQLDQIYIQYLDQFLDFRIAQLFKFIDRSEDPDLTLIRHADVTFSHEWVTFKMYPCPESHLVWSSVYALIYCQWIERQISHIAQVFSQPSAMLSRVVHLKLSRDQAYADCHGDEWLHLLRQFSAVRTLHVARRFAAGHIALALEGVTTEMVAEVLPVLDLIYLDGQPVSSVEKFLAARQLSGHPVTVVDTEAEFYERVKSYVSE